MPASWNQVTLWLRQLDGLTPTRSCERAGEPVKCD